MELVRWELKNRGIRKYAHFDKRISIEQCLSYISEPQNIAKHSFYPFIYYEKKFNKYNKKKGIKEKQRPICYSAHIDRCIFQYYAFLLNKKYNKRAIIDGINMAAIAYRDNIHKNNIHFAKEVIDFIRKTNQCYIIVGDFTGFFDNLNHKYLKARICDLLNKKSLPDDYYAIYKNITKFATWDLNSLLEANALKKTLKGIKKLNTKERVLDIQTFHKLKKDYIKKNKNSFGIPQGSAISAVLSNVYMIEFDKTINQFVSAHEGLYRRYSDDFIIILQSKDIKVFDENFSKIKDIIGSIPGIKLQSEKTKIFHYNENSIENCTAQLIENGEKGKNAIEYLGFIFDGERVGIREKTISKYYYRMYRKMKPIIKNKGISKYGKKISFKKIYEKYSYKGCKAKGQKIYEKYPHKGCKVKRQKRHGNFISYVCRTKKIFNEEPTIDLVKKRHMQKIKLRLNKIGAPK